MKTLLIYDSCGESGLKFKIESGDLSRFNGAVFNAYIEDKKAEKILEEINEMYPDGLGGDDWTEDTDLLESKKWDKVAIITFIP